MDRLHGRESQPDLVLGWIQNESRVRGNVSQASGWLVKVDTAPLLNKDGER